MQLNTLSPARGAKKQRNRVGRGIGSNNGKTCGRGHKGQKSRSGGFHKVGFEGGQMPLQRRLPKFGFTSRISFFSDEVALSELNLVDADVITLDELKKAGLVRQHIRNIKIMLSGEISKAVTLQAIRVSKGAKAAIEKAGGKVE